MEQGPVCGGVGDEGSATMKLLHDGKTVLAVLDGDAEVAVWTDLTVFAGTPAMCRAEIERLGLTVGLAPAQLLAESDDDRLAFELLRQKAAINERLVGLKLSQKAVDAASLAGGGGCSGPPRSRPRASAKTRPSRGRPRPSTPRARSTN